MVPRIVLLGIAMLMVIDLVVVMLLVDLEVAISVVVDLEVAILLSIVGTIAGGDCLVIMSSLVMRISFKIWRVTANKHHKHHKHYHSDMYKTTDTSLHFTQIPLNSL